MPLKRIYDNWQQLYAASGPPRSVERRRWREYLRTRPLIAYWGDSWFSTPLYKNLYWNSFARIEGMSIRLGGPGLSAAEMCTPSRCADNAARFAARDFDLLCVSIGGNDCLGANLQRVFASSRRMDAERAFRRVVDDGIFERLRGRYTTLLTPMQQIGRQFRVVGHTYVPLHVDAIGERGQVDIKSLGLIAPFIGAVGPWLWPTMRPVLGSKAEAARFARLLLVDGFRDQVLVPSREDFRGLFTFADFSSLDASLGRDFWFDEIHPTEAGFATLSLGFNAMIQAALPAPKQAAVFA